VLGMIIAKQYKPAKFKDEDPRVKIVTFSLPLETVEGSKTEESAFWSGMSIGAYICANKIDRNVARDGFHTTHMHEQGHTIQQYVLGTLLPTVLSVLLVVSWFSPEWHVSAWVLLTWLTAQPVLYILSSLIIYVTMPNKHSYFDNPFEVHARWFAEDEDWKVTKEMWQAWNERRGLDKNDRSIWW